MKTLKTLSLAALLLFGCLNLALAQGAKKPAASPHQVITQDFATSQIVIDYSRPGIKGRTLYKDLAPYGKVWRTGANAVTTIEFGQDVELEGHQVKAGKYAIYTIPNQDKWTIILNKDVDLWGTEYKEGDDVLRFDVKPVPLAFKIETFTINVDQIRDTSCVIYLAWDQTYVPIKVSTGAAQ